MTEASATPWRSLTGPDRQLPDAPMLCWVSDGYGNVWLELHRPSIPPFTVKHVCERIAGHHSGCGTSKWWAPAVVAPSPLPKTKEER